MRHKQVTPVIHTLQPGESIELTVGAAEVYSAQRIAVNAGESYQLSCDARHRWVDMIIWAAPTGYRNPLARLFGVRLRNENCFMLCGAYNENDTLAFAIGTAHTIDAVPVSGTLSFFANDVPGFEWNNWGRVCVVATRLA